MSYGKMIACTGVWIIVLPFLGFSASTKKILLILTGAMLILFAALLRQELKSGQRAHADDLAHQETKPTVHLDPIQAPIPHHNDNFTD